jgi:hypothetical protein
MLQCFLVILGEIAKLRTGTVSFVMPVRLFVCLCVHTEQLGYDWTDFQEI